ncbi:MAG: DUF2997 domain-containing protein [Chloroflexota bacterium]|nr:MAG: DUF2997 domain-containing protein [Chloroflexota bacterium]
MPEIRFEIDMETGELTTHVKGVPGKGCVDIQKLVEDLVGEAQKTEYTAEFHRATEVSLRQRVER